MRRRSRGAPVEACAGRRGKRASGPAASARGQILEEYVLILGLVALPLLAALPAAVAAIHGWMARLAGWWGLPVP